MSEKGLGSKVSSLCSQIMPSNYLWFAKLVLRELLGINIPTPSYSDSESSSSREMIVDKVMKLNKRLAIPGNSATDTNNTEIIIFHFAHYIKLESLRVVLKSLTTCILLESLDAGTYDDKKNSVSMYNLESFKGILLLSRFLGKIELGILEVYNDLNTSDRAL
jgi:hypothetical protein